MPPAQPYCPRNINAVPLSIPLSNCSVPLVELAIRSRWSRCVLIISGPLPLVHISHVQGQVFILTPSCLSSLSPHCNESLMCFKKLPLLPFSLPSNTSLPGFYQVQQSVRGLGATFMFVGTLLMGFKFRRVDQNFAGDHDRRICCVTTIRNAKRHSRL